MDKKQLAKYALMGLSSALLIGCQNGGQGGKPNSGKSQSEQSAMSPQERAFHSRLNAQGKRDFESMKSSDREKAMKEANKCSGKNSCKGIGGCSTSDHSCKGQNSCKGQGGCSKTEGETVSLMKKRSN